MMGSLELFKTMGAAQSQKKIDISTLLSWIEYDNNFDNTYNIFLLILSQTV